VAVTFRSKTLTTSTGTSATATEPAGAASGDMLIALCIAGAVISQPAGWTQLFKDTQGTVNWVVSYVARGASAPNLGWTWSGSVYYELHLIAMQPGVNTVAFDSVSSAGSKGSSAHDPDPPATVAVKTTSLAVCGGVNFGAISAWTAPSGYTVRTTNTGGIDAAMCDKSLSASGSENPAAITLGTPNDNWWDGFTATFTDEVSVTRVPYQPQYLNAPVMAQ
jgi:hypothetical protein